MGQNNKVIHVKTRVLAEQWSIVRQGIALIMTRLLQ